MIKLLHIFLVVLFLVLIFNIALDAEVQHNVQHGETLSEISEKYGVSLKSILETNGILNQHRLQIGQMLLIPVKQVVEPAQGIWYKVQQGDTLSEIALRYGIEWKKLQFINSISSARRIRVGAKIFIPNGKGVTFACPLKIPIHVTSGYGRRFHPILGRYRLHEGIDLRASIGTRVYAVQAGEIIYAGRKGGYGKIIGIQHDGDFTTWYGHLSRIRVSVGESVGQGKVIGLTGDTGFSTGPHLHFEIRYKGKSENPARYLALP